MTNTEILNAVYDLAGPQRNLTFSNAAAFILQTVEKPTMIETGCYRGNPADGQSTIILALLAKHTEGYFESYELNLNHVILAQNKIRNNGAQTLPMPHFVRGDSRKTLLTAPDGITFAYLDSYDWDEAHWLDPQAHQLVETGILLPKMAPRSAFLLDDCDLPRSGKAGLSIGPILACGYKEVASGYQKLFVRE